MNLFITCQHSWKILSEKTTESRLEHMKSIGYTGTVRCYNITNRKFIQIVTCTECGKLKRFVEEV